MKMIKKHYKKFICGALAVAILATVIAVNMNHAAVDVYAQQNTFYTISQTDSYQTKGLKILEVTASTNDTELGYFIKDPKSDEQANIDTFTYGRRFNSFATATDETMKEAERAFALRRYGMVKPYGADNHSGTLSEYPIYDSNNKGLFSQSVNSEYTAYAGISSGKMISGHYEYVTDQSGAYTMKDGYIIASGTETLENVYDADGKQLTSLEQNYIYKKTSLSANAIPVTDGTVSGNTLVWKYEKIESTSGIPEGVEAVSNGTGDVTFTYKENYSDIYYGYDTSETKVGFLSQNRKYAVGNWLKEYILGDSELSCNITYKNVTLDQLSTTDIDSYDLIYISGTAAEYVSMDMTDDALKELYNQSAIYHKAVIMDYEIYDDSDSSLSNLDKLALLLWQEDQEQISEQDFCSNYFTEVTAADGEKLGLATKTTHYTLNNVTDFSASFTYGSDIYNYLKATMMSGYNGNFAVNNVYVYNHHYTDFQSSKLEQFQTNALGNIANGDLNSLYNSGAISSGFAAVAAYISYNNETLATLKRSDASITTGSMTEGYITPAIVIQYILSYGGEDLALSKASYQVLEIEPTREFKFNSTLESMDYSLETADVKSARQTFVSTCLNENMSSNDQMDLVEFTSITVDEFNTLQTSLLDTYDVIYIGSENETYYEHVSTGRSTKITKGSLAITEGAVSLTKFNNTNMTGNVYYAVGDSVNGGSTEFYSSRDLTEAKLTELKEYLDGGGLVIGAADLIKSQSKGNLIVNPTAISNAGADDDHGRMDTSSNMYAFFSYATGNATTSTGATTEDTTDDTTTDTTTTTTTEKYYNCISEGDLGDGLASKTDVVNYLNRERVTLDLLEEPAAYSHSASDATLSYLAADKTDGKYYLDYQFTIESSTAVLDNTETYEVHFYQDINADGKFSDTEELHDYEITLEADDTTVTGTEGTDGVTHYNLSNGVVYNLRRNVPSDEGGIINWCLKVEKVSNTQITDQATGYAAIEPREKKYINILQIIPDDNATINLEELLSDSGDNDSNLRQYLLVDTAVTDQYEISARTVTVSQFQADTLNAMSTLYGTGKEFTEEEELWQYFFSNFERTAEDNAGYTEAQIAADEDQPMSVNMVILGFGDTYTQFTNLAPTAALSEYITSGKPLLTSNNVIAANILNTYTTAGKVTVATEATVNANLLDSFAQDRYGFTKAIYNDYLNPSESNQTAYYFSTGDTEAWSGYAVSRTSNHLAVAYTQSSKRAAFYANIYPYTNTVWSRMRSADEASSLISFINANSVESLSTDNDPTANATLTWIDRMNDGQISHYPYTITSKSVTVSKSHAQYFQLDLDTDSDVDGNSDTVVWYTLSDMADSNGNALGEANIYSVTPGDGINNYYIYNSGNVTFTGFGANSTLTDNEAMLFVNTLVAAYESGIVNPTVSFYETSDSNGNMLDSIAVPYDENVTGQNEVDSSIQYNESGTDYLYKFVNPNTDSSVAEADKTKAYFKVTDTNLIKGVSEENKYARVYFYMGVDADVDTVYTWKDGNETKSANVTTIQLEDNTVANVVRIPITVYSADFSTKICDTGANIGDTDATKLEVGTMYGFYVPMSYLEENGAVKIYIQANTGYNVVSSSTGNTITRPLGTGFDVFTIIKQDLLKLD